MANRLANSTSPYLLAHAANPVDWWEWEEAAFEEARRRNLPVLLSVGYAAYHWCHVMAHESFEDEATAAYLNKHFVSIKIDREERPDVDAVYMNATQAITGHGGWPMTCVLDHDRVPFFAGTYFPDGPRQGSPSFRQVLEALSDAWRNSGDDVGQTAEEIRRHLQAPGALPAGALGRDALARAVGTLAREFDPANAGLLAATGTLGVDADGDVSFDIHYSADGASADGRGLAALKISGSYRMYQVELLTGKARVVGAFPASRQVTDLTAGFRQDELEGVLLEV